LLHLFASSANPNWQVGANYHQQITPQLIYMEVTMWRITIAVVCTTLSAIFFVIAFKLLPETKGRLLPENLHTKESSLISEQKSTDED
jgi:hypothetical protein